MYETSKRIFDVCSSLIVLLVLLPFLIIIVCVVALGSKGGAFYVQERIGKEGEVFRLLKFRTMKVGADKMGQITIGNDSRVTGFGKFLRKSKLDEMPQLINVLKGDMSVVGPRPEVQKYVSLYSAEQLKVLSVRPGLTDVASIEYIDEQKLLGESDDPEKQYIEVVMPAKLALNLQYIERKSFFFDLRLIFRTIGKILF